MIQIVSRIKKNLKCVFLAFQSVDSATAENPTDPLLITITSNTQDEDEEEDEATVNLGDILTGHNYAYEEDAVLLPMHFRCAAHSLNLVASNDSRAALKPSNSEYARTYYRVFGILSKAWNKYNQSVQFGEQVQAKLGKAMVTPTSTRWNSTYDAVMRVLELYGQDRVAFNSVLGFAKLPSLNNSEVEFLEQWSSVMGYVAQALDLLQGDKSIYLGHLLPTIRTLTNYLEDAREDTTKCQPLIKALLEGISKRFDIYFTRREFLVATAYLPGFKVDGSHFTEEEQENAKRFLIEEVQEVGDSNNSQLSQEARTSSSGSQSAMASFFAKRPKKADSATQEVNRFLMDDSEAMESLLPYRRVKRVFLKYNCILPSSASSERLFSRAKLILRRTRQRLGDSNFEAQLLLSANKA